MLVIILLLLATATAAQTQPVILLDKEWKEPLTVVSETERPSNLQFFPVYKSDIDTVIKMMEWFIQACEESRTFPEINGIKEAGASRFVSAAGVFGKMPGFKLNLVTHCGHEAYCMELVTLTDGRKKRLQKLRAFLYYLRNNRFLVDTPL